MKVLVTGTSRQQCGLGNTHDFEPVTDLIVKGLRTAGVDARYGIWQLSDTATRYDGIAVSFLAPSSVASLYLYHALDAIAAAEEAGVPWVAIIDDWRIGGIYASFQGVLKDPRSLVKPFFKGRSGYAWALDHQTRLLKVVDRLVNHPWPTTIVPAFAWGNHKILANILSWSPDISFADLSPLARPYTIPEVAPRDRNYVWILGTISDPQPWLGNLGAQWPVKHLGSKMSGATLGQVPEATIVAAYGRNWGVLSPPYKSVLGSGWWRNRFVYAAHAGAILYCDPREAAGMGPAYQSKISSIEGMAFDDLIVLAQNQRNAFFKAMPSPDAVSEQLKDTFG